MKGLENLGFLGKFFVAIFAVCAARGAWAEFCDGYDIWPCPGYENNRSVYCKVVVSTNCDGVAGCKKYEACQKTGQYAGSTWYVAGPVDVCHIEMAACYANTISCNAFDIDVFNGAWSCNQQSQTGTAQWVPAQNAWDTLDCACSVVNKDIGVNAGNTVVNCKKANAIYYVALADRYRTRKLSEHVYYSIERSWCAQCYPGYLPNPVAGQSDGIGARPDDNGNWGVWQCDIQVTQPDYADGCVIKFNLPTGADAYDDCRKECPTGFETDEPGAESITDCVAKYTPEFEDQTGRFVLTSLDECP